MEQYGEKFEAAAVVVGFVDAAVVAAADVEVVVAVEVVEAKVAVEWVVVVPAKVAALAVVAWAVAQFAAFGQEALPLPVVEELEVVEID